jgi:Fur family ferric uptake transcriptional regulator
MTASRPVAPLRSTRQRTAVARLLDDIDDFRSAQEIHEELRHRGEGIGLTTVYRTLQTLAEAGEIDVLRTTSGEALYRRCSAHHHHHLVCRQCGRTVEVEGPTVAPTARLPDSSAISQAAARHVPARPRTPPA